MLEPILPPDSPHSVRMFEMILELTDLHRSTVSIKVGGITLTAKSKKPTIQVKCKRCGGLLKPVEIHGFEILHLRVEGWGPYIRECYIHRTCP